MGVNILRGQNMCVSKIMGGKQPKKNSATKFGRKTLSRQFPNGFLNRFLNGIPNTFPNTIPNIFPNRFLNGFPKTFLNRFQKIFDKKKYTNFEEKEEEKLVNIFGWAGSAP